MDQSNQTPATGVVNGTAQMTCGAPTYLQAAMAAEPAVIGSMPSATQINSAVSPNTAQLAGQHPLSFQQVQQFYHQHQQQQLQTFWLNQMVEIHQTTDFKNQSLPLARIKKIMKADEDVRMISAEAPVVFAKACELFILELTLRAWIHSEENKRRTLQKNDIAAAISRTDIFDFLVDIVPRDELKEEEGLVRPSMPNMAAVDSVPYYYEPGQHPMASYGMIIGKPVDQTAAAATYATQQFHPVTYMWQQRQATLQQLPPQDQNGSESD